MFHTATDRKIDPDIVESVLQRALCKDDSVQMKPGRKSNVRVFECNRCLRTGLILRIVTDITTDPWTVITYYPTKSYQYCDTQPKTMLKRKKLSCCHSNSHNK